jgi:hypothetical protein
MILGFIAAAVTNAPRIPFRLPARQGNRSGAGPNAARRDLPGREAYLDSELDFV